MTSKNMHYAKGQQEKVNRLLALLKEQGVKLVDQKGNPSESALFRWLVEEKLKSFPVFVVLNNTGVELFGESSEPITISAIVNTFSGTLTAKSFEIDGSDVLYRSTIMHGLSPVRVEYDESDTPVAYWVKVGTTV